MGSTNESKDKLQLMHQLSTLQRRVLTTLVLWAVVLAGLFALPWPLLQIMVLITLAILVLIGLLEFYRLAEKQGYRCYRNLGILGGLFLVVSTWCYLSGIFNQQLQAAKANDFETGLLVLFVLGLAAVQLTKPVEAGGLSAIAVTLFGILYVAWLTNFIQKVVFFPKAEGIWYLLYFLVVTKFGDMGAYIVGSLIGRHKMAPRLSPGKTWEGFCGALALSTLGSLLMLLLASDHLVGLKLTHAISLGLVLGCGAVVGDLIESMFKRAAQVKDSGNCLPGIGGVLDLLDSLLFNAPVMYLYLRHVVMY